MCGSGGSYSPYIPGQFETQMADAKRQTEEAGYEQEIAEHLRELLSEINPRDAATTNERLAALRELIEDFIDDSIDLRFGGSVSRHTYVNGLSDVDALVLLNEGQFATDNPQDLLRQFERLIHQRLVSSVKVERGSLAVTVTYGDGMVLQLLPALRTGAGVRIAASDGDGWSNVIHPERFARRLTQVNQSHGGRVVPLIKIAKAIGDQFPPEIRPRGHHVEALAIEAFQNYQGRATHKAMLEHFLNDARNRVRTPLRDSTGQSDYLDDYLGGRGSQARQSLSNALSRIHTSLQAADDDLSSQAWLDALGL